MGDFNLHIEENSYAISEFNNSLDALGLIQHVDFPTHIHGRSLDLVITEFTNGVDLVSCEAGPFLSDHCAVKVTTREQKENIVSKSISFRNFKNMNKQNFTEDLQKLSLDSDNVETFVGQFENTIESLDHTHAPMQEKTQICRAPKPWFNETIMSLKRLMRKSERLWRKHRKPCDYEIYKSSMNKYHHELRNEKHSILSQKVLSFKGDSKKLYKFVKDLTGSKAENPMPAVENENELPDKFADFFMNKIKTIRDSLRDFYDYKPLFKDVPLFTSFKNLSEDEVKTIINKLQCKSCELDILPTKVLKSFLSELLPVITKILIAVIVTCFLTNDAYAAQCGCATEALHVRSGAVTTHRLLGTVPPGECHTDKGGRQTANGYTWANIDYNGHDAWAAINWLNFKTCQTHQSSSSAGCPNIVSRAGWGARSPTHPHYLLTHTPNHVYIHHGASGACHTKTACIAKVKGYQNWHMDGHHYSDIEYSFVVGEDGNVYEARGWDAVGAHTLHHNHDGLGICVIGNFMEHVPNAAALNAIKNLIKCGVNKGKITANYILKGHRDVGQTACPGQKLYDLIQTWPHYHH